MFPTYMKVSIRPDVEDPYFASLVGVEFLFLGVIDGTEDAVLFNMSRQLTESGIPLSLLVA
jgi:hypothetical protein